MQQFDYLVIIGRFQPFHAGHKMVMDSALSLSKRVIIVLGSHNQPRSFTNMWLSHERQHMILSCYSKEEQSRIDFAYQETFAYNNNKWVASIQNQVDDIIHKEGRVGPAKVGLIGHAKDYTSYYLKLFPTWKSVNVAASILTNATDTRVELMETKEFKGHNLLPTVIEYIKKWK